jgi:hypothetical protein
VTIDGYGDKRIKDFGVPGEPSRRTLHGL